MFTAASGRDREGGLGVRFAVWLEVPPEAEEDGQFQEAQVEVPHGAAGEDRAGCHLCSGVFSGEEEIKEPPLDSSHLSPCDTFLLAFKIHHMGRSIWTTIVFSH